ncbi:nicotinamide-nucleotide amidohydrolase family protein [Corynebacterium lizhenjunii]|uniref:nicotinamide-nucleotide amidohydrolase family protein n=1 Tax=Corynebacterium lizhenjunii TaxID=2709394 RepID=UPI001F43F568|nr:nicotinamide-nucleotide amidohydrolase family protein [Corynebacterium lizhenjunii]
MPEVCAAALQARAELAAREVVTELTGRGRTLASCESLTAGLFAATCAAVPGASAVLRGGLVTYATEVKAHFLAEPLAQLERQGVVSAETALAMARAARRHCGADWAVSLTGVAGPDLQEGHPPGTVFIGITGPAGLESARQAQGLAGGRQSIRYGAVERACQVLLEAVRAQG